MVGGVAIGYLFPDRGGTTGFHASDLQVLSSIFLRMIKSLIAPLIFATPILIFAPFLPLGIGYHFDRLRKLGVIAICTFLKGFPKIS